MKKAASTLVAAATLAITLTGCVAEGQPHEGSVSQTPPPAVRVAGTGSNSDYLDAEPIIVPVPDGEVLCVWATGINGRAGLSCNWDTYNATVAGNQEGDS